MNLQSLRFIADLSAATPMLAVSQSGALVVLAFVLAACGGYIGLGALERLRLADAPRARLAWWFGTAAAWTMGLWAASALSVTAMRLSVALRLDVLGVVLAILPVAAGSALAVSLLRRAPSRPVTLAAAALLGLGLVATHYINLASIGLPLRIAYTPGWFAGSLLAGIGLTVAAVWLAVRRIGNASRIAGAILVGAALFTLAETALQAASLTASASQPPDGLVDAAALAAMVALAAIVALALIAAADVATDQMAQAQADATRSRALLGEAVENLADGLLILNERGYIQLANAALRKMFPELTHIEAGITHYDAVLPPYLRSFKGAGGVSYASFDELGRRDADYLESESQIADGRTLFVRDRRTDVGGHAIGFEDVTAERQFQRELEHMALHDALTGLPNRVLFEDRLKLAAAQVRRRRTTLAMLYIDLDLFKPVNDTFGHDGGDAVLREMARRLTTLLRSTDTAARMGGDEFAVILQPDADAAIAAKVAGRINQELARPVEMGAGQQAHVTASIGVALYPTGSDDLETLVQLADNAMYQAKTSGGDRFVVHGEVPALRQSLGAA